jgi:anti-sigma B factor antagonist
MDGAMSEIADLRFSSREGRSVAHVHGEIDLSNADVIGRWVLDRVTNEDLGLVVDLTEVDYVDSAGIAVLFDLSRRLAEHQQSLTLVVPEGSTIRRSLELGGLLAAIETMRALEELSPPAADP